MRTASVVLAALLSGLLAACGGVRSVAPDHSTLSEVRAKVGNPTDIRFDSNGDELWEYGGGYKGTETYLVRAGRDGLVKSVMQLRSQEQFDKIQTGRSTKADVRDLLGQPSDESFLYNGTSWTWRGQLTGQRIQFVVHFGSGNVALSKLIMADTVGDDSKRGEGGK